MISMWDIYFISILDPVKIAFAGVAITCFIVLVAMLLFYMLSQGEDEDMTNLRKYIRYSCNIWLLTGMLAILIPSSKTVATMIVLPAVINNEKVQQISSDLGELVKQWVYDLRQKDN